MRDSPALGLSRTTTVALSEYIIDDESSPHEVLAWLRERDIAALPLPALVRKEVALALRHPERLSAIIVQNAPLYPWEPRGWWATLGQYWADGSAEHSDAARSYLDRDGLRGQYLSGVQDPSRIDPDDWVIDKALIDRPGVDEIMLDLLYDIGNQVPVFKAMQEFLRDRRPPTLVATGADDEIFPEEARPADPHRPPGR